MNGNTYCLNSLRWKNTGGVAYYQPSCVVIYQYSKKRQLNGLVGCRFCKCWSFQRWFCGKHHSNPITFLAFRPPQPSFLRNDASESKCLSFPIYLAQSSLLIKAFKSQRWLRWSFVYLLSFIPWGGTQWINTKQWGSCDGFG